MNIIIVGSLDSPMINGNYHETTFFYFVFHNFYIKNKTKAEDLKGSEFSWFPLKSQLVVCGNSYMIKRFRTLDDNLIPTRSFTLEVGQRSKKELDRIIDFSHNTPIRPLIPFFEVSTTM
jgi:hypothetical protein